MKTKRTAIVAFLIFAIMAISIGFAAISRNLDINGNANLGINEAGFSVAFVQGDVAGDSRIDINQNDKTQATFTVNGLKVENQEVIGTFTVENTSTSNYDAVLANPVVTMTNSEFASHISVTASFVEDQPTTIGKGETTKFTVTVKLLKVINDSSAQVTFQVITRATSALPQ